MLIESQWKVLKHYYLPKFLNPELNFVIYIIISHLIPYCLYNNIINILIKEKKCHGKKILKKNGYIGKKRYQGKLYNKYRKMDMQLPLFFIKSFLYINI
jgi:hypothetical protein